MLNILIHINDLITACRLLGEVKVLAAGTMYATLETSSEQRQTLSKYKIHWQLDNF